MVKKIVAKKNKLQEFSDEKIKRLTIKIPVSLHKKLKISAVEKEKTMTEIICDILEKNLKES